MLFRTSSDPKEKQNLGYMYGSNLEMKTILNIINSFKISLDFQMNSVFMRNNNFQNKQDRENSESSLFASLQLLLPA